VGAFWGNQLTTLTIPGSVASIGEYAFYNNQLTTVTVPDCSEWLSSVRFGTRPFTGNASDPFVIATDGKTAAIIGYNSDNKVVEIPERIHNLRVTAVGGGAFDGHGLFSVTIPATVTHIGNRAFADNKLTRVTIPGSVTHIGAEAFYDSGIGSITLPKSVTFVGENAFNSFVGVLWK
jgi:hypothetical protein